MKPVRQSIKRLLATAQIRAITTTLLLGSIVVLAGCGGYVTDFANGTERQTPIFTPSSTPNFSVYSGVGQPDKDVSAPAPLTNKTPREDINITLAEESLEEELDEHRRLNGLRSLTSDPRLALIARHHSYDMATRGFFNHTNPDGENHADRLKKSSYKCFDSAENIHWTGWKTGNRTSEEELAYQTILSFTKSAPHNEAMLVPQYNTVGIGIYVTDDRQVFVTMLLCV